METTALPDRHDLDILRRLAGRKAAIAQDPTNLERRRLWLAHDAGEAGARPMVLAEVGGVMNEVWPGDGHLACRDAWARKIEKELRTDLWNFDVLRDDHVVEPWMTLNWAVDRGDFGVQPVQHRGDNAGRLGARRWDAPLSNLGDDFKRLQKRTPSVDRAATQAAAAKLEAVFRGILPVRLRGGFWWTLGMTIVAIDLIGLENLMLYMYDDPDGLHRLMGFLCDDHLAFAHWLEREGLLSLNNANDYIGSGSMGYTCRLPAPGASPGGPVRLRDLWVLLESQETVGVSPELFEAFIFPYQERIAREFGLCYYGCCEPVDTRLHVLRKLPNLARVSVSPWADEARMAEGCGRDLVYSRKPSPTLISTERFDEGAIRADLRRTLDTARGCRIELIMKDVHTLNNEPGRLPRWVQLAREEIDRHP